MPARNFILTNSDASPNSLPSPPSWRQQLICAKSLQICLFWTLHVNEIISRACVLSCFSRVRLFVTPWTVACQVPLSMGFSRQEHWSRLPCPPPGDLPDPGMEPTSPALAGRFFTTSFTWEAHWALYPNLFAMLSNTLKHNSSGRSLPASGRGGFIGIEAWSSLCSNTPFSASC